MLPWRRKKPEPVPDVAAKIAGVVPCAGDSARMGRPKALLDAGGRSFVSAVVGSLVAGGCDPVVVVVGEGRADEERRAAAAGAHVLVNPEPGDGPITSLRLALASFPVGVAGLALLPVDHPLVSPETIQTLVSTFLEGDAPVVLPVHEGRRGHPVIFRDALFPELADPRLEGGARTVVHAHLDAAALVSVDDPGVLMDIDTPEAYRAAFPVRGANP